MRKDEVYFLWFIAFLLGLVLLAKFRLGYKLNIYAIIVLIIIVVILWIIIETQLKRIGSR
jgi:hypothetical protein